jgi:ParB-like chromosome segregation protein Spo0J
MRLERIGIERLVAAPYNPRKELKPGSARRKRLEKSLAEFDLVQPIVWNERTGHIVGGHQRVAILRQRGVQEVDVAVVSLDPAREKALNIALNNDQVGSDWDISRLQTVVGELGLDPTFDLTLTGFDDRTLRELALGPVTLGETLPPVEPDAIRVLLEVTPAEWESVRAVLDPLVEKGVVRTHVRRGMSECFKA